MYDCGGLVSGNDTLEEQLDRDCVSECGVHVRCMLRNESDVSFGFQMRCDVQCARGCRRGGLQERIVFFK